MCHVSSPDGRQDVADVAPGCGVKSSHAEDMRLPHVASVSHAAPPGHGIAN